MRESSEAPDDVGVHFCPADKIGITECAHKRNGALLVGEVFGVLEGEIEEQALGRRDFLIEPARDRALGHTTRKRIGRESLRFAAEHIAWKLIEHEDE